jgi:hypothetical protein
MVVHSDGKTTKKTGMEMLKKLVAELRLTTVGGDLKKKIIMEI